MYMTNIPSQASNVHKNEVHLGCELAKDPVISSTHSGKKVANLSVCTKYKQTTEYHRVICWEDLCDKVEKLSKGDFVRIVGRLQTRSWEDKQSGQKKYVTEIVAFQVLIPSDEPEPLTPDPAKDGIAMARAILRPAKGARGDHSAF
jgi:single stranded DNA-binding protein